MPPCGTCISGEIGKNELRLSSAIPEGRYFPTVNQIQRRVRRAALPLGAVSPLVVADSFFSTLFADRRLQEPTLVAERVSRSGSSRRIGTSFSLRLGKGKMDQRSNLVVQSKRQKDTEWQNDFRACLADGFWRIYRQHSIRQDAGPPCKSRLRCIYQTWQRRVTNEDWQGL